MKPTKPTKSTKPSTTTMKGKEQEISPNDLRAFLHFTSEVVADVLVLAKVGNSQERRICQAIIDRTIGKLREAAVKKVIADKLEGMV